MRKKQKKTKNEKGLLWRRHWEPDRTFVGPFQFRVKLGKNSIKGNSVTVHIGALNKKNNKDAKLLDGNHTEKKISPMIIFILFYLVLPSFTWFYLDLPSFTWFYLVLPSFTWFYLVLLGFT